ncbi:hypothetical protein [Roseovarius sp. M141]|uniref:hypothetical protein n=1 Tax=Roseovarius sp. M141 TaxID=2583806 RepID=UPI0020CB7E90|nr:hypothetical protein [Roseovarius sp. M141]MCQ0090816.1 hypothetical protein [Roseovarius sp. M141]
MANQIALATDDEIKPGEIRFSQAALPPLPAGAYALSGQQEVVLQHEDETPTYQAKQEFIVDGPRFALAPTDVQMVVPPANQAGDWENYIPNIVLRRRILPWVRTIDGNPVPADTVSTPWMGLISLTAAELGGAAAEIAAPSPVVTGTAGDLVQSANPAIAGPKLNLSPDELKTPMLYLDLEAQLFQAIAPTLDDLMYLAHVRDVNTDDKEILGLDEDGSFSVVVGNRIIQTSKTDDVVNYVFLVSLEGHQDHLPGHAIAAGVTTFRLASLAWWKVQAIPMPGDFIEIMQNLPKKGGVDLVGVSHKTITATDENSKVAAMGLGMGYAPLTYRMRAGEDATAWYRGPLSAVPTKNDDLGAFQYGDLAIRYDPKTALFDLSQAAAWQIGRLLGLSDATFARQLYDWRRAMHAATKGTANLTALAQALPEVEAAPLTPSRPQPAGRSQMMAHFAATTALGNAFAAIEPHDTGSPLSAIPRRQRREDRPPSHAPHGERLQRPALSFAPEAADGLDDLLDQVFGPMQEVE